MNDNIELFIFDFDGTLVKGHSHNYIGERLGCLIARNIQNRFFSSYSYEERAEEIARLEQKFIIELMEKFLDSDHLGWKNEEQLVRFFKNIILSGHKIAIASFNDYPHAVKYALESLLGKEDAAKIYIKSA
ncbi:HAD family hydrolase [Candidatus Rickettsia kedanie]|uniref:HAD family hydrolase n=1 Tax=Candidatus Rickettsia kedanie TaxID=3115352 RepID=A0ABP9TVW2_9RICK